MQEHEDAAPGGLCLKFPSSDAEDLPRKVHQNWVLNGSSAGDMRLTYRCWAGVIQTFGHDCEGRASEGVL